MTDTVKNTYVFNRICISPKRFTGDFGPFSRRQGHNCSRHSMTVVTTASMIDHDVTWWQLFVSWRHASTSLTQSQTIRTPRYLTANSPTNRHQNLNPDHPHRIVLCYKHQSREQHGFTYTNKQGAFELHNSWYANKLPQHRRFLTCELPGRVIPLKKGIVGIVRSEVITRMAVKAAVFWPAASIILVLKLLG